MAYIRFAAAGERLAQFRDAVRRSGIRCSGQQVSGTVFRAATAMRNENRLCLLAAEYGVQLEITARGGLRPKLMPYLKRPGLFCGLLLGIALIYWCNATVRGIEISGNTRVSDAEILTALDALGVREGVPFRDLPYNYIEQRMRLAVSDIEWITVRHEGGLLIVDLTEERQPPEMVSDRIPCNVVAAVPAQITKMDVRGGFAMKKVGDIAAAGELLISGVQDTPSGVRQFYHAAGIVEGQYPAEFTKELPFVAELPVSSETVTETVLSVFGHRFSVTPGFRPPDDAAALIYEEDSEPLMLCGRALPLAVLRCRYIRQAPAITVFSETELRAMLEESAAKFEQNYHAADRVISKKAEFFRTDLGMMLKINYVFEGVIGKTSEIFVNLS